jgi:hypothetical protein
MAKTTEPPIPSCNLTTLDAARKHGFPAALSRNHRSRRRRDRKISRNRLAIEAGFNAMREFLPDLNRLTGKGAGKRLSAGLRETNGGKICLPFAQPLK